MKCWKKRMMANYLKAQSEGMNAPMSGYGGIGGYEAIETWEHHLVHLEALEHHMEAMEAWERRTEAMEAMVTWDSDAWVAWDLEGQVHRLVKLEAWVAWEHRRGIHGLLGGSNTLYQC
jgi:transposase InsO family protein